MNNLVLTKEIAYKALQNFFNDKPFVLFGTGTSCAVDPGFGMGALEAYLKEEIPNCAHLNDDQQKQWNEVVKKLETDSDFEAAMNAIEDELLVKQIVDRTAEHIAKIDQKTSLEIIKGDQTWPAIEIFKRLVDGLPAMDRRLHVATPNYDLLAEYAFAHADIPYCTGYWGGVIRRLNWLQAERQMTYAEKIPVGRKFKSITRIMKHICLYKVHGSLNTFRDKENRLIENNAWILNSPEGFERLMITPGSKKHETLHDHRDTLLGEYDKAIKEHSSFLFLGFGFNDTQLVNNAINEKLINQASSALIITLDSNDRIQDLLERSDNTWLVCKHPDNASTRIYNKKYDNWLELPDKQLWRFDKFATEIMGK